MINDDLFRIQSHSWNYFAERKAVVDFRRLITSWPIREKLIFLILAVLLPWAVLIIQGGIKDQRREFEGAKQAGSIIVESLATQQEQIAAATKGMLGTLALSPQVQSLDPSACSQLFSRLAAQYPYYSFIGAINLDGYIFAASLAFPQYSINLLGRKHIQDAISTLDFSVGEYIVARISGVPTLHYAQPVFDKDKNIIAILIAGFKLDEFTRFINKVNLPPNSTVLIFDHQYRRLYRHPEDPATPLGGTHRDGFGHIKDLNEGTYERTSTDGVRRIYCFKRLSLNAGSPPYLLITVGIPREVVLEKASQAMMLDMLVWVIAAFISLSLAVVFGKYAFTNPITKLVDAAQRFGAGDINARTGLPHTRDELGKLAQSFDELAHILQLRETERNQAQELLRKANAELQLEIRDRRIAEEALRKSEEWLQMAQRAAGAGTWDLDLLSGEVKWSEENYSVFGLSPGNTTASFDTWKQCLHPQDREVATKTVKSIINANQDLDIEYRIIRNDEIHWINSKGKSIKDDSGHSIRLIGINVDITERKIAEARRAKLETQSMLFKKAESLRRMAGAISHHFNNQLAVIMGNLDMVLIDLPSSSTIRHNLVDAFNAGERAAQISSLMLTYLGSTVEKDEVLDLSEVCRLNLPMLQILSKSFSTTHDLMFRGPMVSINQNHIRQVLTNLFLNAYESFGNSEGNIHLAVRKYSPAEIPESYRFPVDWNPGAGDYACLEIRDSGCGIPNTEIDKIFDPFYSTKFSGRGMGLSVVLGIVHKCSGVITVESEPDIGSVFRVFFPVAPPPPPA